jgi:HEAT repeat protein
MGRIQSSALSSAVVPTLISALDNPEREVRLRLVPLAARVAPDAKTVIPALIKVLREPLDSDRRAAGQAVFISYAGPAQQAARELGRLAPGTALADAAVSALSEVVQSGPDKRWGSAADALSQFGPAGASAVGPLISMLERTASSELATRDGASAAAALGEIAPRTSSAAAAVTALTAALKSQSIPTRQAAIEALSSFGSAAAPAIPSIREIAEKDPFPNVRKAAQSTLEAIKDGSK